MTPGDSNGEGGEARPFRAESITRSRHCIGGEGDAYAAHE